MEHVIIGVDSPQAVGDDRGRRRPRTEAGSRRFTTDKAGFAVMRKYVKGWPSRMWAVEGANGVGRPLAQRLLEAGEAVVDVPAKLAARARLLDTGHGRKTDAHDAHSVAVAVAAVCAKDLRVLAIDPELQVLRMLVERREARRRSMNTTLVRSSGAGRAATTGCPEVSNSETASGVTALVPPTRVRRGLCGGDVEGFTQ